LPRSAVGDLREKELPSVQRASLFPTDGVPELPAAFCSGFRRFVNGKQQEDNNITTVSMKPSARKKRLSPEEQMKMAREAMRRQTAMGESSS